VRPSKLLLVEDTPRMTEEFAAVPGAQIGAALTVLLEITHAGGWLDHRDHRSDDLALMALGAAVAKIKRG
jgi:hypothetical protein